MVEIVEKQPFSLIGKMGEGDSSQSLDWIAPLWEDANRNFSEIRSIAKVDVDRNLVGIWGAMSDVNGNFERWGKRGRYLAGCEVNDDALPPSGWTKWTLPAYKYAVSKCSRETYQDMLHTMLTDDLPKNHHQVVGAIQEFYNPKDNNGELYLYFPIERI